MLTASSLQTKGSVCMIIYYVTSSCWTQHVPHGGKVLLPEQRPHVGSRGKVGLLGRHRQQVGEPTSRDLRHAASQEKSIVQRVELLALWKLVGRADHADEGDRHAR